MSLTNKQRERIEANVLHKTEYTVEDIAFIAAKMGHDQVTVFMRLWADLEASSGLQAHAVKVLHSDLFNKDPAYGHGLFEELANARVCPYCDSDMGDYEQHYDDAGHTRHWLCPQCSAATLITNHAPEVN